MTGTGSGKVESIKLVNHTSWFYIATRPGASSVYQSATVELYMYNVTDNIFHIYIFSSFYQEDECVVVFVKILSQISILFSSLSVTETCYIGPLHLFYGPTLIHLIRDLGT